MHAGACARRDGAGDWNRPDESPHVSSGGEGEPEAPSQPIAPDSRPPRVGRRLAEPPIMSVLAYMSRVLINPAMDIRSTAWFFRVVVAFGTRITVALGRRRKFPGNLVR